MKRKIILSITMLIFTSLFISSCKSDSLTKDRAVSLLDTFITDWTKEMFSIDKFVYSNNIPAIVTGMKEAGFIDLVPSNTPALGDLQIKILEKGLPYLVRQHNNFLQFKVVSTALEVTEITNPATDENGETACYVKYKETIKHDAFTKIWNPHCMHPGVMNEKAKFVMKEGKWTVTDAWL